MRHDSAVESVTLPVAVARPLSARCFVSDEVDVASVRLDALIMGRAHGLSEEALGRLGIIVTELGVNIVRHARTGQIILRPVGNNTVGWIEVMALDKGPGIPNMTRTMRDGSSATSPPREGGGLAGVKWLSDLFDVYSQTASGTAVVSQVGTKAATGPDMLEEMSHAQACIGVVCVPVKGETECGDGWTIERFPSRTVALVVDGLGHGPEAAAAANNALSVFHDAAAHSAEDMLTVMHTALHRTRGAAASVTVIDHERHTSRFCGVGNVDGRILTATTNQHLIPQNGIVGHSMTAVNAVDASWPTHARLVLHSDGISSRWRGDQYPGLVSRHPALLAGVLFRDFARIRDDATVLVLRDPFVSHAI